MSRSLVHVLASLSVCMALVPVGLRAEDGAIVGRAGEVSISASEVQSLIAAQPEPVRSTLTRDPAQAAQWLRGRILDRLVVRDAANSGFDKQPDVAARLAQAREALLIELYLGSKTDVAPDYPAEAEVRAFYGANTASFVPPKRYRLAQIFVADTSASEPNPRVEDIRRRLKTKNADFAAIARETTDNKPEGEKGGEIGWLGEPNLAPEIRAAVANAKKDTITAPIRMKDGWHLIRVLDVAPAGTQPLAFDQVKATLATEVRRRRIAAEKQAFVEALLKANPVSIDELGLAETLRSSK